MWELIMLVAFSSTYPGGNGGYMKERPSTSTEVEAITSEFNTSRDCLDAIREVQQQISRSGGHAIVATCRPKGQST